MPWCHNCETEYVEGTEKCSDCGAQLYDEMPPSMLPKPKIGWSMKSEAGVSELAPWPKDDKGEKVRAVYLTNVGGNEAEYQITLSMLRAFKIPYVCEFTGMGQLAKIRVGFSASGMDIYVPETMLEDAKNVLLSDTEDEK